LGLELLEGRCVPTTITPTAFADGGLGSGSLRDAVLQFNADAGSDDDAILLQAGTYALTIGNSGGHHETAGLTGGLNLTSAGHRWILQGAGSSGDNATVIDAGQLQDRVLQIVTPGTRVVFRDLVIQGGLAQDDGSDGALAGTTDALGGGLLNNGGDVTLDNVVVQNNVARGGDAAFLDAPGHNARGGGFYSTGGALTTAGATIANNQAIGGRGGDNYSHYPAGDGGSGGGGGLYATGGSLDIANSRIANNGATGGRGGDGNGYTTGSANGGVGGTGQGGGLYVSGGSLTIAASSIASNQGTGGSAGPRRRLRRPGPGRRLQPDRRRHRHDRPEQRRQRQPRGQRRRPPRPAARPPPGQRRTHADPRPAAGQPGRRCRQQRLRRGLGPARRRLSPGGGHPGPGESRDRHRRLRGPGRWPDPLPPPRHRGGHTPREAALLAGAPPLVDGSLGLFSERRFGQPSTPRATPSVPTFEADSDPKVSATDRLFASVGEEKPRRTASGSGHGDSAEPAGRIGDRCFDEIGLLIAAGAATPE
jgi:hypothetical protein